MTDHTRTRPVADMSPVEAIEREAVALMDLSIVQNIRGKLVHASEDLRMVADRRHPTAGAEITLAIRHLEDAIHRLDRAEAAYAADTDRR